GLYISPTNDLNLRASPTTTSDIMAVVAPGDLLKVVGDKAQAGAKIGLQNQWLNVQAPNGVVGWVAAWFVRAAAAPSGTESSGAGGSGGAPSPRGLIVFPTPEIGINLRASPDAESMRIDGALKDEALTVLDSDQAGARRKIGQPDQWVYVEKAGGIRAWAAALYLRV
ncbi:MAG: SH3 domain-containing protein, partial [Anaerolineaceae bacterium]|nr:SH3 domain-containing protein [Anaerolineaceae bacterium]